METRSETLCKVVARAWATAGIPRPGEQAFCYPGAQDPICGLFKTALGQPVLPETPFSM